MGSAQEKHAEEGERSRMKRFFLRLLRRFRSRKLDWLELSESQRQMLLAIKKKHDRYERLRIVK